MRTLIHILLLGCILPLRTDWQLLAGVRLNTESGQLKTAQYAQHVDDLKYQRYRNVRFGYSFEYPKQWILNEALDGGGVSVAPNQGANLPRIGVSGFPVQASSTGKSRTLEEDFDSMMRAMQKKRPSHGIESFALVKKESAHVQGLPANAYAMTYTRDGQSWVEEGLLVHDSHDAVAFNLGFDCRPDELAAFRTVFDKVIRTFRVASVPN